MTPSARGRAATLVSAALLGFIVVALPSRCEAQSSPANSTIQASAQIIDPSTVIGSRSVAAAGGSAVNSAAGLSVVGAGYRVQVQPAPGAAPVVLLRGNGSSTITCNSLAARLEKAGLSRNPDAAPRVVEVVLEVLD